MRMRQLFSYWFFKDKNLERLFSKYECRGRLETFIDSGAFNAFSIGAQVDITDYMRWLRDNRSVIDLYANLDVIGSSEKTLENQRRLEDAGFSPIPVFHVGAGQIIWKAVITVITMPTIYLIKEKPLITNELNV